MDFDTNDLLTSVEQFRNGIISRATGSTYEEIEYKAARKYLLSRSDIQDLIPKFIKTCQTTDQFWQFIKNKFSTYAERRVYINEEFYPLIEYYEAIQREDDIVHINAESYKLGDKIGGGGYGIVYKYWHKQLEINFAIKFLSPSFVPEDEISDFHKRFFREAKMLFSLNHQNIVKFYDTGLLNNKPFIKMEYIDGFNLDGLIERYGIISPQKSLIPIQQIFSAISHAHKIGIIHRDIKPSNILFETNTKDFKVIDFGIGAYLEYDQFTKLTKTGENVVGSTYTAPEIINNPKTIDARSDIYSIGAIWFYLLTGMPPKGSGLEKSLIDVKVSQDFIEIIMKCLANINERYTTCDEVLCEIEKIGR